VVWGVLSKPLPEEPQELKFDELVKRYGY